MRAIAGQDSEGDEGTAEQDVEDDGDECEEGLTAETACEQHGEEGVEDCGASDAFNGFHPCVDGGIAVGEHGEEVGVDAEDYCCAEEFECVKDGLQALKSYSAETHLENCRLRDKRRRCR